MKNEDFVGFDLCVLASSHHTLITYGSFGLWGAILSRGDVIAAKGTNNQAYSVVTTTFLQRPCNLVIVFQHDYWYMKAKLENWTYIDSRDPKNVKVLTKIHDPWIKY